LEESVKMGINRNDLALLGGLLLATLCFSQVSSAATSSQNSLYLGAEQLGKGNAGVSTAKGVDAIFYNPALVAPRGAEVLHGRNDEESIDRIEEKCANKTTPDQEAKCLMRLSTKKKADWEFVIVSPSLDWSTKLPKTIKDAKKDSKSDGGDDNSASKLAAVLLGMLGQNRHLDFSNFTGYVGSKWSLGLFESVFLDLRVFNNINAAGLQTIGGNAFTNIGLVGGYRHTVLPGLSVGATPKLIKRTQYFIEKDLSQLLSIDDLKTDEFKNSGTGVGLNLGVAYERSFAQLSTRVALAIDDLGDTRFKASKEKTDITPLDPLLQTVNFGLAATYTLRYPLTFELNFRDITGHAEKNRFKRVHLGLDWFVIERVGLTAGLNQGYGTTGIYYQGKNMRFYFGTYAQEMGIRAGQTPDQRLYFKWEAAI
jgi:hypothetical protein